MITLKLDFCEDQGFSLKFKWNRNHFARNAPICILYVSNDSFMRCAGYILLFRLNCIFREDSFVESWKSVRIFRHKSDMKIRKDLQTYNFCRNDFLVILLFCCTVHSLLHCGRKIHGTNGTARLTTLHCLFKNIFMLWCLQWHGHTARYTYIANDVCANFAVIFSEIREHAENFHGKWNMKISWNFRESFDQSFSSNGILSILI